MLAFGDCYAAIERKDGRFDGWFVTAVTSTGIYCRPSCPARTPHRRNVRFYATAAAAQGAGFRACKRCRPDASPGSPEWDLRDDLVSRAMRLVSDGVVDREGVAGLARRLGYSERHLNRCLTEAVGAGPLALARASRAQTARVLLERTDLAVAEIALTAGFSSVRQFNSSMREVFAMTPTELRARRHERSCAAGSGLTVRLPARAPFDGEALIAFLGLRAVPGIEEVVEGAYRRSLRLPRGFGVVELAVREDHVRARLWLEDMRDFAAAVSRCRRLLDLDSDPVAVRERLAGEPVVGELVMAAPGRRVAGSVDACETAVRALLGQQVSIGAARRLAQRLVAGHGEPLAEPVGAVTHMFPSAAALARVDPATLPMPLARGRALVGLARAIESRELVLDGGADRAEVGRALLAMPGIGPWTAGYVAMRELRDPDAFLPGDAGLRRSLISLGCDGSPRSAERLAERWRPYRAYALAHLWSAAPLAAAA
ncbi:MAG TPA: AlkA N-terminal domain-containing protein [Solirubrobacteraceae bacterium]|nr:AlkA N-terminal domain-containing protein [Solirubrobacteraceae bacterium]